MKTFHIAATWKSYHTVELEDDVALNRSTMWDYLSDWPEEVLEQVHTGDAELVDWEVY